MAALHASTQSRSRGGARPLTNQRVHQRDGVVDEQVVATPLPSRPRQRAQDELQVAGLAVNQRLPLLEEGDGLRMEGGGGGGVSTPPRGPTTQLEAGVSSSCLGELLPFLRRGAVAGVRGRQCCCVLQQGAAGEPPAPARMWGEQGKGGGFHTIPWDASCPHLLLHHARLHAHSEVHLLPLQLEGLALLAHLQRYGRGRFRFGQSVVPPPLLLLLLLPLCRCCFCCCRCAAAAVMLPLCRCLPLCVAPDPTHKRTWVVYCWNMPGPSCLVISFCLHLHFRLPTPGLSTDLSRVTCASAWFCMVRGVCSGAPRCMSA